MSFADSPDKAATRQHCATSHQRRPPSRLWPTLLSPPGKVAGVTKDEPRVYGGRRWSVSFTLPSVPPRWIEISTADFAAGVATTLAFDKRETARKLKTRIAVVMRHAVAEGHRTDDPSGRNTDRGAATQRWRTSRTPSQPPPY